MIGADCQGVFDPDDFSSALSLATEGSKQIFEFLKEIIKKKATIEAEL